MDNILSDKLSFYSCSDLMKLISSNLRQRRLSLNLTQIALAKKSGISLGSLKRFEKDSEISLRNLVQLTIALDLSDRLTVLYDSNETETIDEILSKKFKKKRLRGRKNA